MKNTSKKILIRNYIETDAKELANIYYNTIHNFNIRDYTKEQVSVWAPETSLNAERWLKKFAKTKPFVAVIDNIVVGFAEFEPNGHIDCFYCHHEWIGCGVGALLMQAIYKSALEQNIKSIFAEVSVTAKSFFEKCGFIVMKEQSVEKEGIFLTNFKMEKIL